MAITTQISLLRELKSHNPALAWPVFLQRYGELISRWCLNLGASRQEVEDIVQETLLRVFLNIDTFEHKGRGSFRSWLKTIARNVWLKLLQKRTTAGGAPPIAQALPPGQLSLYSPDARDDLVQMFDEIARREILNLAMERVEPLVTPATWQVYRLADLDQVPRQEIADRMQLTLNAVHHSVLRVRAMLRREIQKIDPEYDADSSPGTGSEGDALP